MSAALVVMAAVFCACMIGIYSRPIGFLANIWPANAVMLGLLLRVPGASRPLGWVAGAAAFMIADTMTGASLFKASILNSANLAGISTAYAILSRRPREEVTFHRPESVLSLVIASAAAGCAAGIVGGLGNPILFGGTVFGGWSFWAATEFVNYIMIMPAILSAPSLNGKKSPPLALPISWKSFGPAAALVLSCVAAFVIGGPGAIAFPVPALLWCGLAYSTVTTAGITLLFGIWTVVVISSRQMPLPLNETDELALASIRLGASLIALVPIILATVMQSRNDLLAELHRVASHDPLTGVNNRGAFLTEARRTLQKGSQNIAVFMIDLDHFKVINDTHGHAAGDQVLVIFANRIRSILRCEDLFGRHGGEEFAVLAAGCTEDEMNHIGDRIREAIGGSPVALQDGQLLHVTASVGAAFAEPPNMPSLDALLSEADKALYLAKRNGRNRLEIASTSRRNAA